MTLRLFHNPRCSKSRAALRLLEQAGTEFEVVLYLETPPTRDELAVILERLACEPSSLVRSGEALFAELGIATERLDDSEFVADLLAEHPRLIERPLLVSDSYAVIGRPPENVLDLLEAVS